MGNLTRCPHCSGLIMIDAQQSIKISVDKFAIDETIPKKEIPIEQQDGSKPELKPSESAE